MQLVDFVKKVFDIKYLILSFDTLTEKKVQDFYFFIILLNYYYQWYYAEISKTYKPHNSIVTFLQ